MFRLVSTTDIQYISAMEDRFDPAKDAVNQIKHQLSLAFGDRIFEDDDHLILPSIREIDGEERFKVVGLVGDKLFTGVFVWRGDLPRFISVRRSNTGEERAYRSGC
jgi:uncharacterized protein